MPVDLFDIAAAAALAILVIVFGVGRGPAIERLWSAMRYECVLLWTLPTAYRLSAALREHDVGDIIQRAQAIVLSLCAAWVLFSVARTFRRRWGR